MANRRPIAQVRVLGSKPIPKSLTTAVTKAVVLTLSIGRLGEVCRVTKSRFQVPHPDSYTPISALTIFKMNTYRKTPVTIFRMNTYKNKRLKAPLESTLTGKVGRGTASTTKGTVRSLTSILRRFRRSFSALVRRQAGLILRGLQTQPAPACPKRQVK